MIKVHSNCPTACVSSKLIIYTKFHYTKLRVLARQVAAECTVDYYYYSPTRDSAAEVHKGTVQVEGEGHPNQERAGREGLDMQ